MLNPGPSQSLPDIHTWHEAGQWHAQVSGLVVCADTVDGLVDLIWGLTRC